MYLEGCYGKEQKLCKEYEEISHTDTISGPPDAGESADLTAGGYSPNQSMNSIIYTLDCIQTFCDYVNHSQIHSFKGILSKCNGQLNSQKQMSRYKKAMCADRDSNPGRDLNSYSEWEGRIVTT